MRASMRRLRLKAALAVGLLALAGAACSSAIGMATPTIETSPAPTSPTFAPTAEPAPRAVSPDLNPTGPKDLDPRLFLPLLPRDAIRPVYSPTIVTAEQVQLDPEDLVIGVSIGGQVRAYPIGPLRFREMVNDELGGTPILVTW